MNFYYYSNEALDFVKSLRKSGSVSQSDIDVANKQATLTDAIGTRIDVIRLFLYPLGKDQLYGGSLVDDKENIYENEIDVTKLPVNVAWALRDTRGYRTEEARYGAEGELPLETHMNNWIRKHGHSGRGVANLLKAIKKYTYNSMGRLDLTLCPVVEIYPYVGYVRVNASNLKSF